MRDPRTPPSSHRGLAEALWAQSRELRARSAHVLRRKEAALQQLAIRRELARSRAQVAHLAPRCAARAGESAEAAEEREIREWMCAQVLEMIADGWGPRELADVGIRPALLEELGLDDHPALRTGCETMSMPG